MPFGVPWDDWGAGTLLALDRQFSLFHLMYLTISYTSYRFIGIMKLRYEISQRCRARNAPSAGCGRTRNFRVRNWR